MNQIYLGKTAKKKFEGQVETLWCSNDEGKTYWSGNWSKRTPKELKDEAESVLRDLKENHPELFKAPTREDLRKLARKHGIPRGRNKSDTLKNLKKAGIKIS